MKEEEKGREGVYILSIFALFTHLVKKRKVFEEHSEKENDHNKKEKESINHAHTQKKRKQTRLVILRIPLFMNQTVVSSAFLHPIATP